MQSTILTDKRSINEISSLIEFCTQLVIKDEDKAEEYETNESISRGYKLINAMLRVDNFDAYVVTTQDLRDLDCEEITYSLYDPRNIPLELRDEVLEYKRYQVYRDYMLNGDSNKYYEDIYQTYIKNEESIMTYNEFKKNTNLCFYVTARLAKNYSLLWHPKTILSTTEMNKFKKCYIICQQYFLKVCYNDAYKVSNPKYNNLSILMIIFMVIKRYINSRLENIDDIDFFDEYSIRNMFLSYGLDYFFDMPLKYQRRVLKNLNYLIKNKGTNKAIISILEMFGFTSIKVMKYFLCKEYPKDVVTGELLLSEPELKFYGIDSEETSIEKGFKDASITNYDEFVADDKYWQIEKYEEGEAGVYSPDYEILLAEPFNYIYTKYVSIEGVMDISKATIDFSYYINFLYRLKDTVEKDSSYKNSLYFYNYTLSNDKIDLINSILLLFAVVMKKFGYKDTIIKSVSGITKVFDYNLDKETTPTYYFKKAIKREKVSLSDYVEFIPTLENVSDKELFNQQKMVTINYEFINDRTLSSKELDIINSELITYEWLYLEDYTVNNYKKENLVNFDKEITRLSFVNQFVSNQTFRKQLENMIVSTRSRELYRKYMAYYKKCFLSEYRYDLFGNYETFTDYLRVNDPTCYSVLEKIKYKIEETPADEEIIYYEYILEICNSIDTYLDSDEMDFVVQGNVYLTDYVKQFIYELVEFIRSYTIYVKEISTIYLFDDRFLNKIKFFDELEWNNIQKYLLLFNINDRMIIDNKMKLKPDDMYDFIKELYEWSTTLTYEERLKLKEVLGQDILFKISDLVRFNDNFETDIIVKYIEDASLKEKLVQGNSSITLKSNDRFTFEDLLEIIHTAIYNLKEILIKNDELENHNCFMSDIVDLNLLEKLEFGNTINSYNDKKLKFKDNINVNTNWVLKEYNRCKEHFEIVNEFSNIEQFNMKEDLLEIDNVYDNLLIFYDTLEKCKQYEDLFIVKYDLNQLISKKIYIKRQDEEYFIKELGAVQFYIAGDDSSDKRKDFTVNNGILILSKRHGQLDYIAMSNTLIEFDQINLIEGDINNE